MDVSFEKIRDKIYGSPAGICSVFVRLDEKWGIKLYGCQEDRDDCYKRQKQAAEGELGPEVGDCIDFPEDCDYPYVYLTEVVEVLVPHNEVLEGCGSQTYEYWIYGEGEKEFRQRTEILHKELYDWTGISYSDLHPMNIGVKNGKWILIDFGFD